MSLIFAGTPDFAARVLRELEGLGRRPALVVSQPDRPRGRGRKTCPPAAAKEAERLGIPVLQVDDLNTPDALAAMTATGASTLVVAAFGQMLREAVLERFLCLNVHASLLPAYRGAAPIERALAAGEERTGVSIMRMTAGLDEGPYALQTAVSIGLRDDVGSLTRTLAVLGASGIDQVLTGLDDGTVIWTEQQGASSYACKLGPSDTLLDPRGPAKRVHDQVRAVSPAPGMRARCGQVEFKVWRTWPYGGDALAGVPPEASEADSQPGRVLVQGDRFFLGCGEGVLELLQVQPVGKARMASAAFLRGYGSRLSEALSMDPTTAGTAFAG